MYELRLQSEDQKICHLSFANGHLSFARWEPLAFAVLIGEKPRHPLSPGFSVQLSCFDLGKSGFPVKHGVLDHVGPFLDCRRGFTRPAIGLG